MRKEVIAMVLAGGRGERLEVLTENIAKPIVPFGGKYKIIDFTLSNCTNSGIDTVGVLTQYEPFYLNNYLGKGTTWDLYRKHGGISILPPFMKRNGGEWYKGTANAVYQNLKYIEHYNPKYVLILSGDHIYNMDYSEMLNFHKESGADSTVAVINVPLHDASRYGIIKKDDNNRIYSFDEKPKNPKSSLASMGIYIFKWEVLRQYLINDDKSYVSNHDFGKDLIPSMLNSGAKLFAYSFTGYWKDVGTIESLWEANMDLLGGSPKLNLYDRNWLIYSYNPIRPPVYLGDTAKVRRSIISDGCKIHGEINNSVISQDVFIGKGCIINNSVIMPDVIIHDNVTVDRAIICQGTVLNNGTIIRGGVKIALVGDDELQLAAR